MIAKKQEEVQWRIQGRGPGDWTTPSPPIVLYRKSWKKIFGDRAPSLYQGLDDWAPLLSEGLDPPL